MKTLLACASAIAPLLPDTTTAEATGLADIEAAIRAARGHGNLSIALENGS